MFAFIFTKYNFLSQFFDFLQFESSWRKVITSDVDRVSSRFEIQIIATLMENIRSVVDIKRVELFNSKSSEQLWWSDILKIVLSRK